MGSWLYGRSLFDAVRRGKKELKYSRDKNEAAHRSGKGGGGEQPVLVALDPSYD